MSLTEGMPSAMAETPDREWDCWRGEQCSGTASFVKSLKAVFFCCCCVKVVRCPSDTAEGCEQFSEDGGVRIVVVVLSGTWTAAWSLQGYILTSLFSIYL